MKKYLIGLIILSSIPAFAQSREIRVTSGGECSSIVPTGELGIFLQKSQVKKCAKEDAVESLYSVCQNHYGGELVDHGSASICPIPRSLTGFKGGKSHVSGPALGEVNPT